ncbi:MAG: metallophosphoesterase [Kiritimatiellia bacterium]
MFKILFQSVPYAFALLLMGTYVLPARMKVRAQAIWAMTLLACAAKFTCFGAFGGDVFNPELPEKLIWFWNWAHSGMCLLLPLSIPWAFIVLLTRRMAWGAAWRAGGRIALPVLAWGLSLGGIYNGLRAPEVVEVPLVCPNLPAQLDGYRIVHLTDLHISAAARRWRTAAIAAKANAARPDLIVCTGDIVDGIPRRQARNAQPLCDLKAPDGALFVTGNHEYYSDWLGWEDQYKLWGFRFLHNEWVSPRTGLVVAGVDDPAGDFNSQNNRFDPRQSLNQALDGAPTEAFRILLQHRPSVTFETFGKPTRAPYDLQLSGHTHGGIAPGLRTLVAAFNRGFVRGLYVREDGSRLYVSPGAGQWAGFPIRFFNDPEITLFTLRRQAAE